MSNILKVIEVLAESDKGWEDAAKKAIKHAHKSVRNVKSIYIESFKATVKDGNISSYQINAKISFLLEK